MHSKKRSKSGFWNKKIWEKKIWEKKIWNKKRAAALLLSLCMLVPGIPGSADTIAEAEDKIAVLQSEKAELDGKLAALEDDENKAVEYQATLQEKIDNVESQINEAQKEIQILDSEITVLEAKIAKSEEEMGDTLDIFYQSVNALYKSGSAASLGTLEILLNSNSLYEFSMKNEAVKSVTAYNQQITDEINAFLEETSEERGESQEKKEQVAQLKLSLEGNQEELVGLYAENKKALEEIQKLELETEQRISENEAESEGLMLHIEELIAEETARKEAAAKAEAERRAAAQQKPGGYNGNAGAAGGRGDIGEGSTDEWDDGSSDYDDDYTPDVSYESFGGSFTWPIPGVYTVTQHYGMGSPAHNGIDIAGPYGTPIVAAESGNVIEANDYDEWGDSWGYYVLIWHNGTYTTRYAHLSSLAVGFGQEVSKGQVIGYEGSTGNSTGPHLHFEVYENGGRVNPYPFIS